MKVMSSASPKMSSAPSLLGKGFHGASRRSEKCVLIVVVCSFLPLTSGINGQIPLVSDDEPTLQLDLYRNEPGCILDHSHYKFEEKWSPVFLEKGRMHCVKCQCLPVEKKGIVQPVGKVKCKNIKDECPRPLCTNPVLLPDRCCKTCQDSSGNDFESNFSFMTKGQSSSLYSRDQQEPYRVNEFRALLVGRHVRGQAVKTTSVAVLHLTAHREQLAYSLRFSSLDKPKFLQITDANRHVLLSSPIQKPSKAKTKVCGVWPKVPDIYLQYLREGRLLAVVTSSQEPRGLIAGRLFPNDQASTESFSSVLSAKRPDGVGGAASFQFDPNGRLMTYVIYLQGSTDSGAGKEYQVSILKGKTILHLSTVSTKHSASKISGTWKLNSRRQRKQLVRGRLRMWVTSQKGAPLTGAIYPRVVCGVFQAVLSGANGAKRSAGAAMASAVVELNDAGNLDYKVRVVGLESPVSKIRLESETLQAKGKVRKVILGSLHTTFLRDNSSSDGWSNGTYTKLEANDLHNLLNNRLYISIVTARQRISQLRGRLVQTPVHQDDLTLDAPIALRPMTPEAQGSAAHAWLSLSASCALRYEAVLANHRQGNEVEEVGGAYSVLLGTHHNRLRRHFRLGPLPGHAITSLYEYNVSTGSVSDVPQGMIKDLDRGRAFIQIISGLDDKAVFQGNVTLPNSCWQNLQDADTSDGQEVTEDGAPDSSGQGQRCNYEGTVYGIGDSWLPETNSSCFTCSCMKGGRSQCHQLVCPPLDCPRPVQLPGICCSSCPEETWSEFCEMDEDPRRYPLHHTWHPFLPLEGFAKCAVCTCKSGNTVECGRLQCPELNCPGQRMVRRQKEDCCQVCGPRITDEDPETELPQLDIDMDRACNFQGQWKADGVKWHPTVKPFGHLKCFLCHCRGGKFKCGRTECPKLNCKNKIRQKGACCDECDAKNAGDSADQNKQGRLQSPSSCSFGGLTYENGARWRPPSATSHARCARCKCQEGKVQCKIRCPKKCQSDRNSSPCCRHCADDSDTGDSAEKGGNRQSPSSPDLAEKLKSSFPLA